MKKQSTPSLVARFDELIFDRIAKPLGSMHILRDFLAGKALGVPAALRNGRETRQRPARVGVRDGSGSGAPGPGIFLADPPGTSFAGLDAYALTPTLAPSDAQEFVRAVAAEMACRVARVRSTKD